MKNSIIYKYMIRFNFMEDCATDIQMQREIRDKANMSMAILGKGLEQHLLTLRCFDNSHKKISRYGLWNLFTDEELLKYNPQNILEEIKEMHYVEQRLVLDNATKFYLKMWLDVEGPYSSIIKRKTVSLDLYEMGVN